MDPFDSLLETILCNLLEGKIKVFNDKCVSLKRLTQIIATSGIICELRKENKTMLLRDVYYSMKHVFEKQEDCNTIIFEIGKALQLKRYQMGIIPSSKGMICGNLQAYFLESSCASYDPSIEEWNKYDTATAPKGALIDNRWSSYKTEDIAIRINDPRISYLLVIEKEAIFYRLIEDNFISQLPSILVTSCGYPDVATRALVAKISMIVPNLMVLGVCDYNPHGLGILMSFKFNSSKTSFEANGFQTDLRWLGLRSHHILAMRSLSEGFSIALKPLSQDDFTRAKNIREKAKLQNLSEYVQEMEHMVESYIKCEIESLYHFGLGAVTEFLVAAIKSGDFI